MRPLFDARARPWLLWVGFALVLFWHQGLVVRDVGIASLVGLPAAVIGALIGDRLAPRVHEGPFRAAVLGLLALSGVLALASAVRA